MNRVTLLCIMLILGSVVVFSPLVSASEGFWESMAEMPTKEGGVDAGVVDGKIYVIDEGINYMYDPAADDWTIKTPMPTSRYSFGIAVYQNKIYIIGGAYGNYLNRTVTGVIEVYNPATDTWETKTSMPTPRWHLDANVVDGKIYLISRTSTELYDPQTDTWDTKKPMPIEASFFVSAVMNGKIYVMGGQGEGPYMNFTQIYDTETDSWGQGAQMPVAVLKSGAGVTTGTWAPQRIYVLGGQEGFFDPSSVNLVYDPEEDVWTQGSPIPTPRHTHAVAVVDDRIYVIGGVSDLGYTAPPIATVERYTPAGWIPEFPSWMVLILVLITVTGVMVLYRRRI